MPFYVPPKTDTERLNFLRTAVQTAAVDYTNGIEYISRDTFQELHSFLPQFDEAFLDAAATFGQRDKEVEEQEAALDKLKQVIDDMWEVISRRVRRHGEPTGVLRFYYLNPDGSKPNPDTLDGWFELAENIVAGDADAVAAGYDAAACPPAAELAAALASARKEAADVIPADAAHDRAQAAIAALRSQADEFVADAVEELRFHLRKEETSSQRRIMRTYGARFAYNPGEPRDMDDVGDM